MTLMEAIFKRMKMMNKEERYANSLNVFINNNSDEKIKDLIETLKQ